SQLVAGRDLVDEDRGALVLSHAAAASLEVGVGDSVSLLSTDGVITLRVVGVNAPSAAITPARDRTAVMTLADARTAFMQDRDVVTRIDVLAVDPAVLDGPRGELASLFGGAATIRLPADELRDLALASRGMRFLLLLSGAMALVAAGFLIATNLFAAVEERSRDLAMLRGLGVPGVGAAAWLLVEAACVGLAGSLVGAVAGAASAFGLLARLPNALLGNVAGAAVPSFPLFQVLVFGVVAGVLVSLVVAWPLASRARTSGGLDVPSRLGEANGSATTVTRARLAEGMLVALLGSGAALVLLPLLPVAEQALTRLGRGNWTGGQAQALGVTLLVLVLGWMAVRSFPLLVNRIRAG